MKSIQALFDLSSQVAVVTGGGMGIGKAIAIRLAEAGAAVVIADIDVEAAGVVVAEIKQAGGKAAGVVGDTSQVATADSVMRAAQEHYGDLNILVNNAGIYRFLPALNMTEALWDKTLGINLKGVMFYSKAAAEAMLARQHGGRIINIASTDAFRPTGALAHYDASKGGVVSLTMALAQEWAPRGILVNAIAPGGIVTPGTASLAMASGMKPEHLEEMGRSYVQRLPLRRMGDPDDIARVALFLASSASDYMVGHTLVVDGGALIS